MLLEAPQMQRTNTVKPNTMTGPAILLHQNDCMDALKIFAKYLDSNEPEARKKLPTIVHVDTAKDATQLLHDVKKLLPKCEPGSRKLSPDNMILQDTSHLT